MKHSVFQEAIYAHAVSSTNSLIVEAVAGSGKSTTMVHATKLLPNKNIRLMAFNKSIAGALQTKVTGLRTEVSTMHSLGLSLLRKEGFKGKIDGNKVRSLCWEDIRKFKGVKQKQQAFLAQTAQQIISFTKQNLHENVSKQSMLDCLDYFGIEEEGDFDLLGYTQGIWSKMKNDRKSIDFDDMINQPAMLGLSDKTDILMLDEVQDLNYMQQKFCLLQADRILAFGDSRQAIYGFAGADTEGMGNLRTMIQGTLGPCDVLPLSICYRCPVSVVKLAKKIVPQIEASPKAPEGVVKTVKTCSAKPGDFVLCRCTAPLVQEAMAQWAKGVKACVLGKDMGKQIEAAMESWGTDILVAFEAWDVAQTKKLENRRTALRFHTELRDVIKVLLAQCAVPTQEGVSALMKDLFSENIASNSVNLLTIHRSKGLEADTVWLLRPDLLPHPQAQEGWQMGQEKNLEYVAYTRSMNNLYIVSEQEECPDDEAWDAIAADGNVDVTTGASIEDTY